MTPRARVALALAVAATCSWAVVLGVLLPLSYAALVPAVTLRWAGGAALVLTFAPLAACPRERDVER